MIARYRGRMKRRYFRADAAFANPDVYELLEAEGRLVAWIGAELAACLPPTPLMRSADTLACPASAFG